MVDNQDNVQRENVKIKKIVFDNSISDETKVRLIKDVFLGEDEE